VNAMTPVATKPVLNSGRLSLAAVPWNVSRIGSSRAPGCAGGWADATAAATPTHKNAVKTFHVTIGTLRRDTRPLKPSP